MKTNRCLLLLGVLTGTLLLSGCCMVPMMAGMMAGHGDHKKDGTAQVQAAKACECETCGACNSLSSPAPASASTGQAEAAPPAHKH